MVATTMMASLSCTVLPTKTKLTDVAKDKNDANIFCGGGRAVDTIGVCEPRGLLRPI